MSATAAAICGAATTSTRRTSSRTASCRSSGTRSATSQIKRQRRPASPTPGLPGQVALPIFEAAFGPRGSQPAVPAASGFTNGTFITQLQQGQAGRLANTLADREAMRATLCAMVGNALAGLRQPRLQRGRAVSDQLLPGQPVRCRLQHAPADRRVVVRSTTPCRSSSASATARASA